MAVLAPSDQQERTLGLRQRQRLNAKRSAQTRTSSLPTFFVASAFESSLLGLEEDGKVSRLIPVAKAKRRIVNFLAAMRIHTPFVWTLGHDKKTSAFSMLFVQSAKSPQKERQTETDRETDRQRQTETDRDRQRQTETDRDRQRQTETDRDRQRQTETDRQRQAD